MFRSRSKYTRQTPAISTASLPDIVFILLFFFMVITKMRTHERLVVTDMPKVSELTNDKAVSSTIHLYIGRPQGIKDSTDIIDGFAIQMGNEIRPVVDIGAYVNDVKSKLSPEKQKALIAAIKVDKDVPMHIIDAVELALRKANLLKVKYYGLQKPI
jgi:biopolymer transport protein ExbD